MEGESAFKLIRSIYSRALFSWSSKVWRYIGNKATSVFP
jgi:hypothetical protein